MSISSREMTPLYSISFRNPLLFYLKTNAAPRLSLKLMQISKYFCFKKFPYKVVKNLRYGFHGWEYLSLGKREDRSQIRNLDYLTKPLWLINELELKNGDSSNLLSHLLSKTAICDIKILCINFQHLKMDEFQFLVSSKAVECIRINTAVFYDDGSIVPVDEIVKMLPKLKEFRWFSGDEISCRFTKPSTNKLIKYLNPSFLTRFELWYIPETFDFELFSKFMDKNPLICFYLHFDYDISDEYAKILQNYVDKLVENDEYKNRKILMSIPRSEKYYVILYYHFYTR